MFGRVAGWGAFGVGLGRVHFGSMLDLFGFGAAVVLRDILWYFHTAFDGHLRREVTQEDGRSLGS